MRRKILMSALAIALAAALIAGATMAWFTDSAEVTSTTFTAGTVEVNVDSAPTIAQAPGKHFNNVNPGDCATVTWTIINDGTKAAQFRVKLNKAWAPASGTGELSASNVYYAPKPGSNWVMREETDGVWLYYVGSVENGIRGTFDYDNPTSGTGLTPATVELPLVIGFDGAATGNEYQGASFTIDGTVEAVQASNGAPAASWTAWSTVSGNYNYGDYNGQALSYINYFLTGAGHDMSCWTGGGSQEPDQYNVVANVVAEGSGHVNGNSGSYSEGDTVTLTAEAEQGYTFDHWTYDSSLPEVQANGNVLTFTMPGHAVTVTANFAPAQAPTHTLTVNIVGTGTVNGHDGTYSLDVEEGTEVSLDPQAGTGFHFVGWDGGSTDDPLTFTMPATDVTRTATFEEDAPVLHTLTVNIVGNGTVNGNSTSYTESIAEGTVVSLDPQAATGSHFVGWDGGSTADPLTFTMPATDVTRTATFAEDVINYEYKDLKVSAENKGGYSGTPRYTKVTITGKVRNYSVNGTQVNVSKIITGLVNITGFSSYSGTTASAVGINTGWSSFTITYNISGGYYADYIDGKNSNVRIIIDGVQKP